MPTQNAEYVGSPFVHLTRGCTHVAVTLEKVSAVVEPATGAPPIVAASEIA